MENWQEMYEPLLYGGGAVLGLLCALFGYRLFKLVLIALMAVAGAGALAYAGFAFGQQPVLWSIGGLLVGAIAGAVLALFFYKVAVATVGALFAATTVLPYVQGYGVELQWLAVGAAALVAGLLAIWLTTIMLQLGTAMLGSVLLVYGVRYFLYGETIHHVLEAEEEWELELMVDPVVGSIVLGIGLLGFLWQRRAEK